MKQKNMFYWCKENFTLIFWTSFKKKLERIFSTDFLWETYFGQLPSVTDVDVKIKKKCDKIYLSGRQFWIVERKNLFVTSLVGVYNII